MTRSKRIFKRRLKLLKEDSDDKKKEETVSFRMTLMFLYR